MKTPEIRNIATKNRKITVSIETSPQWLARKRHVFLRDLAFQLDADPVGYAGQNLDMTDA
jgi:hypothetical protein